MVASVLTGCLESDLPGNKIDQKISKFKSGAELVKAFEDAQKNRNYGGMMEGGIRTLTGVAKSSAPTAEMAQDSSSGGDFSTTNIQVAGVDEADIIKTDGKYIYALAKQKLIIVKAKSDPTSEAKILSQTKLANFNPIEIFIHQDKLLVFGYANQYETNLGEKTTLIAPYPRYSSFMAVKIYDLSDKQKPKQIKTVEFEGSYLTSRKIGENVYFVVNSYPHYKPRPLCEDLIPLYREDNQKAVPIAKCTEIGYIKPIQASNFITIASISMKDSTVTKETIVGSGQNVYASLKNLYVAQTSWPGYSALGKLAEDNSEKTIVTKFSLDKGKITYQNTGEVKGHILNQFSMDENDGYFRIATTKGQVWNSKEKSTNNVYILNKNLEQFGKIEDLAPGEKIYSVRFMGQKGYVVTFKKVDPLFVLDLNPTNPKVLGKLKIPGYSDYLHPYDENHLIGIGKEAVGAENSKTGKQLDFAWYQGMKMAIFDVSDVNNPKELHKITIGDRGTNSEALQNHKAFLFDKKKNLLVLPITLAEIKGEKTTANQYGEYTYQGAYVYDLTLKNGFKLKGRVTHYDDDQAFKKSGYYIGGKYSVKRNLYIDNVLYTLSDSRLQLNKLSDLSLVKITVNKI